MYILYSFSNTVSLLLMDLHLAKASPVSAVAPVSLPLSVPVVNVLMMRDIHLKSPI